MAAGSRPYVELPETSHGCQGLRSVRTVAPFDALVDAPVWTSHGVKPLTAGRAARELLVFGPQGVCAGGQILEHRRLGSATYSARSRTLAFVRRLHVPYGT